MIGFTRNDEKFNLDNVSNEELFEGLKGGVVSFLQEYPGLQDIEDKDVSFVNKRSFRRTTYGGDGNVYPTISLATDIKSNNVIGSPTILLTPFQIKLLVPILFSSLESFESEHLTNALTKFMTTTFPDSDYESKKQEYFETVRKMNEFYDNMVFGN